jgi:hypothetical protein
MLGLGASAAMFAIATPYRYGAWLDPGATLSVGAYSLNIGTGLLAALMHVAKVIFIAALVPAWRRNRWAGTICGAVCVPLVLLSIWSAVAQLALQRSARVAEAQAISERADLIRAELKSIGERLALVGWKPLATVEAEIAAERHHWIWDVTFGCTTTTAGSHRQFCAGLARLEGARGAASEAEGLRAREAELRREIQLLPKAAESLQPDLLMLAGWLAISRETAEVLRTLFWAAVVEIVEMAAFGFAGYFSGAKNDRVSGCDASETAHSERELARATTTANEVPPIARGTSSGPEARAEAKPGGHQCKRRSADSVSARAKEYTPELGRYEKRLAVVAFVATLRRGAGLRATGSSLFGAYKESRQGYGWPVIPSNVFGQLLRPAIEAVGGRKVKASRQYYEGVALPPV